MKNLAILLTLFAVLASGCGSKQKDPRIKLQEGVASDTLGSNIVTKPVAHAFSALIGQRIEITRAVTRRNDAGFLQLQVEGFNNSYNVERFQYKVEWLDADGLVIDSKTNVWLPVSAAGKSTFNIMATAPNAQAVDFRMNTRNQE